MPTVEELDYRISALENRPPPAATVDPKLAKVIAHFGLEEHWARLEERKAADVAEAKARGERAVRSGDPAQIAAATDELKKLLGQG